jgi:hypothetical protein
MDKVPNTYSIDLMLIDDEKEGTFDDIERNVEIGMMFDLGINTPVSVDLLFRDSVDLDHIKLGRSFLPLGKLHETFDNENVDYDFIITTKEGLISNEFINMWRCKTRHID